MLSFDDGIASFITGTAIIEVHFPVDFKGKVGDTCEYCPYLSSNNRHCMLNKEPVFYYNKHIGHKCPLKFKENENG